MRREVVTVHVQRPEPIRRRSSLPLFGCGCLSAFVLFVAFAAAAVIFLLPRLPQIGALLLGFSPQGDTQTVFANVSQPPTVVIQNPTAVPQVTINLGDYGSQTFNTAPGLYDFTIGSDAATGAQTAAISFTEAGLLDICRQRTTLCSGADPRYGNPRVDLRPGGAVIYADVNLPELGGMQQTAGVVLRLDPSGRAFQFVGVDIGGMLYSSPPQSLNLNITDLEAQGNAILNQLALNAGGGLYALDRAYIDDTSLTLVLR